MKTVFLLKPLLSVSVCALLALPALRAQTPLPPLPAPISIPKPAPVTDAPYAPQPILPGGIVVPLFPPGSPYLKADKVQRSRGLQHEPGRARPHQQHRQHPQPVHRGPPGRARPSTPARRSSWSPGGGHNTLNVGGESADFVPFFYNYGVNTVILRNRLRRDGYNAADRRRPRRPAGRPRGPRLRQGMGHRPQQDRHHGLLRRAPNSPRPRRSCSRIGTRRTATPPTRWPASPRVRTSSASSTPAPRPSPATAPRRRSRATCRRRSSSAAAPATGSTRSGPWSISARC